MGVYVGWAVDRVEREELLKRFPPRYPKVVADHVTLAFGQGRLKLPTEREGTIVGEADDGAGVQALVVEISGTTDRPDGSTYHITWSLGPGRRAVESNDVIRERGWTPVERTRVSLEPKPFKV